MRSNRLELEGRRYLFVNSTDSESAAAVVGYADLNSNTVGRATGQIPPRFDKIHPPPPVDTQIPPRGSKNLDPRPLLDDVGLLRNTHHQGGDSWVAAK